MKSKNLKMNWCNTCVKLTPHNGLKCLTCVVRKPAIRKPNKGNTKLTAAQVEEIIEKRAAGVPTRELAKCYNVSVQTIQDKLKGTVRISKELVLKWVDERIDLRLKGKK